MPAGGTAIEMPAQGDRPTALDRAQDTEVLRGQPGAMGLDEACAVSTDDVSHLEGWPGHRLRSRRVRRTGQPETRHRIKRVGDGLQMTLRQVQVDDRVLEFDVTEQELHGPQVGTRFDEV